MKAYRSPADFRRALTDRLRRVAEEGKWTLPQLQRQLAYDRMLERLYRQDRDWIVKGAVALLARDIGVRASIDVDIYRAKAREVAEAELRAAAATDLRDWFRFEIGAARVAADGAAGIRLPVKAFVGNSEWASFHVDLVGADLRMTGTPDDVPAIARVTMPDLQQGGYRAYPLADHIADKVAATFERHGNAQLPSTRFHDLVDLVAIATSVRVSAEAQLTALASEASRRSLTLPTTFDVPDREIWERGYARAVDDSVLEGAATLDEALAVVRPFLDPLLDGTADGWWDPTERRWSRRET